MLKVCVLGAGFMGRTHVAAWQSVPGSRVTVVAGASPARATALAATVGADATTDILGAIRRPDVDIVDVVLPTDRHADVAVSALRAGRAVIVEKPMALSLRQADTMVRQALRAGSPLFVAHVLRHSAPHIAVRQAIHAGRIGQVRSLAAHRLGSRPGWATWFADPARSGGGVVDLQVHDLDVANWLLGAPTRVVARGNRGRGGGWDHAISLVDYDVVPAVIEASMCMADGFPFSSGLRVDGSTGSVWITTVNGGTEGSDTGTMRDNEERVEVWLQQDGRRPEPLPVDDTDAFVAMLAGIADAIRLGGDGYREGLASARLALALALASRRSIESGRMVRMAKEDG